MTMSRSLEAIALAATLAFLGSCAKAPPAATAPVKEPAMRFPAPAQRHVMNTIPAWEPKYSEPGCYTFQNQNRIKWKVYPISTDDRAEWDKIANNEKSACDGTATPLAGPDSWYWYNLPSDRVSNLMVLWLNVDTDQYGYIVVKRKPNYFELYNSTQGPFIVMDNGKRGFKWTTGDQVIHMGIQDPLDNDVWKPGDFWFHFYRV